MNEYEQKCDHEDEYYILDMCSRSGDWVHKFCSKCGTKLSVNEKTGEVVEGFEK